MNKQRALEILQRAIEVYDCAIEHAYDEKERRQVLIEDFGMTEEEYDYVFKYNFEMELKSNLSRSLCGAELITDNEEK